MKLNRKLLLHRTIMMIILGLLVWHIFKSTSNNVETEAEQTTNLEAQQTTKESKLQDNMQESDVESAPTSHCMTVARHAKDPLTDTAAPYIEFFINANFQPLDATSNFSTSAFTETQFHVDDDVWFWIDDNAKGLELFSFPGIGSRHHDKLVQIHDFIMNLSPGPFFFRRLGSVSLTIVNNGDELLKFKTSLLDVEYRFGEGVAKIGYKFHDGRDEFMVELRPAYISFNHNQVPKQVELKEFIQKNVIIDGANLKVILLFSINIDDKSVLQVEQILEFLGENVLPKRIYTVKILSNEISMVRLSTRVGPGSPRYFSQDLVLAGLPNTVEERKVDHQVQWSEPLRWVFFRQSEQMVGFSLAGGLITRSRNTLYETHLSNRMIIMTHEIRENSVTVEQDVVILAGGLYHTMEEYEPIFQNFEKFNKFELSISYDYGAELHGISMLMMGYRNQQLPFEFQSTWNHDYLMRKFNGFLQNFMVPFFIRGGSFAMVAAENMYRLTGNSEYLNVHETIGKRLLDHDPESIPFIDNLSAAIWALSRAAIFTNQERYAQKARAFLERIKVHSDYRKDGSSVYEVSYWQDTMRWSFKAGILLRALKAIEMMDKTGPVHLDLDEQEKIEIAKGHAYNYLFDCFKQYEIKTSVQSAETNSETQPWNILGLTFPDHLAYKTCPE
jgi:hypothetical protein